MTINKKILVIILTAFFFLNSTAVLANASYMDNNIETKIVSLEEESIEKEKERLQKKFSGMKEWVQETSPYKSFFAKNQTFIKFRDGLNRFFQDVRSKLDEQWNRQFTEL